MSSGHTCHQHSVFDLNQFGGDSNHLHGRFALPKNHLRKTAAQTAVGVNLRKPEVGDGGSLKCRKDFVTAQAPGSEFLQQLNCFRCGHGAKMPQGVPGVT